MMHTYRKSLRGLASLTLLAALAACGDDPAAPNDMGTMSAEIFDDPGAVTAPNAVTTLNGADPAPTGASSFSGNATGSAQVYIYSDVEGWVELGSPSTVTLDLQSSDRTSVHTSAAVPAGSYTRVRLVLDGFGADLAAGGTIGGIKLGAAVSIAVGGTDGRVEIEKTVTPFTITAGATAKVGFDLNSEVWITQESAAAQSCEDADVQTATTAHVAE